MAEPDVVISAVTTTGRDIDEVGEVTGTLSVPCEASATAQNSEYVTALEGGVRGRCNTRAEEDMRAHRAWLEQVQRRCGSEEEEEFDTVRSEPTWTQVASAPSSSANEDGATCAELEPSTSRTISTSRASSRHTPSLLISRPVFTAGASSLDSCGNRRSTRTSREGWRRGARSGEAAKQPFTNKSSMGKFRRAVC